MATQDIYKLIGNLNDLTPLSINDFLVVANQGLTATGKITISALFGGTGKLQNLRAVSNPNKLFGTDGTAGGVYSEISITGSTGLSLTSGTLSGISATNSIKGVASYDSNDFDLTTPGAVIIKDAGIDHNSTTNRVPNEHINHTSVLLKSNSAYLTGLNSTTGVDITTSRTLDLSTTVTPSPSKIAITDGAGYVNGLTKETVYMQLFPLSESITAGDRTRFYIPTHLQSRVIRRAGFGLATGGGGFTVTFGGISIAGSSAGQVESDFNYQLPASGYVAVNINANSTAKGLDFWFVIY